MRGTPHYRHDDLLHSLRGTALEIVEALAPGKLPFALGDYREYPLRVLLPAGLGRVGRPRPRVSLRDTKMLFTQQQGGCQWGRRDLGLA